MSCPLCALEIAGRQLCFNSASKPPLSNLTSRNHRARPRHSSGVLQETIGLVQDIRPVNRYRKRLRHVSAMRKTSRYPRRFQT